MPNGGPAFRAPRPSRLAADLGALQSQARADERRDESAQLSDSSSLAETRPSPLDLPKRSYTQPTGPEVEGLPSTVMEMQEQRAREEQMKRTAEQFVGSPTTPTAGPETAPAEEPRGRKRTGEVKEEAPKEETPDEELRRTLKWNEQMNKALKEAKTIREKAEVYIEEAVRRVEAEKKKRLKNLWRFINGLDALTAEDIVGLILVLLMMNAQLLNQYSFKHPLIPKLSIPEVSIILCLDCCTCIITIPLLLPSCIILLSAIAVGIAVVTVITGG